jgi:hypothetical protein
MYLAAFKYFSMLNANSKIAVLLIASLLCNKCFSQSVSVNNNGTPADTTAMLDVSSTTKGLLVPRMTAQQKNTIINPATGLLIYQTDGDTGFYYFNGVSWFLLATTAVTDQQKTLIYTTKGF